MFIAAGEQAHEVTGGVEAEGFGGAEEAEVGFLGGAVAFAIVAGVAAGDEVFPAGGAAAGAGHDVVEGELAGGEDLLAILARVAIAHEDVLARKGTRLVGNAPVIVQADDARQAQLFACGVDVRLGVLFGAGDAFEDEHEGTAGGTHVNGLEAGVEDQNRLVESIEGVSIMHSFDHRGSLDKLR